MVEPGLESSATRMEIFLRSELDMKNIERRRFKSGWVMSGGVINTNRLILVLGGCMEYEMEETRTKVDAGTQLFVPNWVRRRWRVPQRSWCEILWCEFATDFFAPDLSALFVRTPKDFALEVATLERMRGIWAAAAIQPEEVPRLRLEGELKGSLARFWPEAQTATPANGGTVIRRVVHPEVRRALAWLEQNFRRHDALEAFYAALTISDNHFRFLFREATRSTVQEYLTRLRLRLARHLVHQTAWAMKRIADESGYRDPLFFSRHYRRFWGIAPSVDRRKPMPGVRE